LYLIIVGSPIRSKMRDLAISRYDRASVT